MERSESIHCDGGMEGEKKGETHGEMKEKKVSMATAKKEKCNS